MTFFPSRTIALSIGSVSVHWYGVMYLLAFLLAMELIPRLQGKRGLALSRDQRDSLILSLFFGVLLGGRLGFALFYGGWEYWSHPLRILAIWEGGMSSHGGFIGVAIALILFARRQRISLLALTDILVIPAAIGLAFGRVGNLINGELFGTVTSLPWGMHFPGTEGLRHPTQIYAVLKDLLIAGVCFLHLKKSSGQGEVQYGKTTAIFLVLYAVLRFLVEYFREQTYGFFSVLGFRLSEGQLLSIPIFLAGVILAVVLKVRTKRSPVSEVP
jgi:phosphatidylglycerol:prolipoprotein diacylglycerol transferase